jgi:folate-binding protein YgfZ
VTLKASVLPARGVVFVSGEDARGFLNNLLTSDVEHLEPVAARYAALLTPQGKILFDMIVLATEDGFVLDVARALIPDLLKRLGMYRLRAKVEIADHSGAHAVVALWGAPVPALEAIAAPDPRLAELGWRAVMSIEEADPLLAEMGAERATPEDYDGHRVGLGVPEAGRDFMLGDAFPHEACMDQLGGVDFKKGCYVGQEVVARMQHKTVVRKRVVPVALPEGRPAEGAEVRAGELPAGFMGSSAGERGLAMLRLDRVADAIAAGQPLTAGGVPIRPLKPAWARFDVPGA